MCNLLCKTPNSNLCNPKVGQDQCVPKSCPPFGVDKDQVWFVFVQHSPHHVEIR